MKASLRQARGWRRKKLGKKSNLSSKKKENDAIIRPIIPIVVFFLLIAVVMAIYAAREKKAVQNNTVQSILMTAASYSASAHHDIDRLKEPAMLVATLLEQNRGSENVAQIQELLKQLCANTDAYMALFVNPGGNGVSNTGARVKVGTDVVKLGEGVKEVRAYYLEDDKITGQPALVISFPVNGRSNDLLAYYKLETLMKYNDIHDYGGNTWSSVMDADGTVLYTQGSQKGLPGTGENLLQQLQGQLGSQTYSDLSYSVEQKKNCYCTARIADNENFIALVPLGINDWYFVMGMSKVYMDKMVKKDWKVTRQMIFIVILSSVIFVTVMVIYLRINHNDFKSRSVALQNKADTDLLTELNNKIATERKIKEYIETHEGQQALMFVFDIDNFKKINDTRGHAFGDEVLRNIGMRLSTEFRSSDIAGRAGGDEFILFLKNIPDEEVLQKEAQKVAGLFKDFKIGQYTKYSVTASIGCAVYPRDADSFETLYEAADKGLYKAKKRGKNQLAFYKEAGETV